MLKRTSTAVWRGPGMEGQGTLTTQSGAVKDQPYSFKTRFASEDGRAGTNPEELIAAAHAGCYSMALSFILGGAGAQPEEIRTEAALTMSRQGVDWTIDSVHLDVTARVPGLDAAKFAELAAQAKAGCPVSKVLRCEITMTAKLA